MKTPLAIASVVLAVAGIITTGQLSAQTTATSPATTPTGSTTVQNIVEITRTVPPATAPLDVFPVPTGVVLILTDVIVTNTGTTAVCGGAVNRGAAVTTTTPTTSRGTTPSSSAASSTLPGAPAGSTTGPTTAVVTRSTGTVTQTDSTVTGPLCVPAQTTTTLPLTTGIEFASAEVVQLLNSAATTGTPGPSTPGAPAPGSLAFHLRGVLITRS